MNMLQLQLYKILGGVITCNIFHSKVLAFGAFLNPRTIICLEFCCILNPIKLHFLANLRMISQVIYCTSLSWSADGQTLFSGYTDGVIRVYGVARY